MLVCQLRIPGLWMYVKGTATSAIEAHGAVYLYVGACEVVDMDVIRDGVYARMRGRRNGCDTSGVAGYTTG